MYSSLICQANNPARVVLLALHLEQINLVGLSTVHGNGTLEHTTREPMHLTGKRSS